MALFGKKTKDNSKKGTKEPRKIEGGEPVGEETKEGVSSAGLSAQAGSAAFSGTGSSSAHKVLKGFYVSEKSSLGNSAGQYTFKVFQDANKSEVKKEVSKLFNVKIKSVKILNMPEKRRDFGKHPGAKSGFKKAIVVLEEGYTIGQAKP